MPSATRRLSIATSRPGGGCRPTGWRQTSPGPVPPGSMPTSSAAWLPSGPPEVSGVGFTTEGDPEPLGVSLTPAGINVAVWSAHADAIELCLFDGAVER